MTATVTELRPAVDPVQVESDYVTQKHECTDLDEFDPAECVPCIGCGHAECRHDPGPVAMPDFADGLAGEELKAAQYAEAHWFLAALKSSPCDVAGCECDRMRSGDECTACNGQGFHENDRTGQTFTCGKCRGNQVTA